jgi:hypothetical protein
MRKTTLLMIAASCLAIALLSCEKDGPKTQSIKPGSDARPVAWTSLADLKPNYVYTLVGNPDKYEQINT